MQKSFRQDLAQLKTNQNRKCGRGGGVGVGVRDGAGPSGPSQARERLDPYHEVREQGSRVPHPQPC